MKDLENVTFVIPLRIDSEERRSNMDATLNYLFQFDGINVIVLEADSEPRYVPRINNPSFSYQFVKDFDPIFYRTHYINKMLRMVVTPVAGIWDSDVIVPMEQIADSIKHCMANDTICYPFDGRFYAVSNNISQLFKESGNIEVLYQNENKHWLMHGRFSVGGAFTVNVEKYLSVGGENEHFYGWGPEDTERRERICNLGLKISRVRGCLYHLYHPRGMNSNFANRERAIANLSEYLKICRMKQQEIVDYISTWSWVKDN